MRVALAEQDPFATHGTFEATLLADTQYALEPGCARFAFMRIRIAGALVLAVATSFPLWASGADSPRKRATCAELRDAVERISKTTKYALPVKVTPGSWGDVPAPLRKLPAGAENCGVGTQGQVLIVSGLVGKELENHYAPLFAEVGCKPLKCTVTQTTNCSCSGADGATGVVLSDVGAESYTLMYSKPKSKPKK